MGLHAFARTRRRRGADAPGAASARSRHQDRLLLGGAVLQSDGSSAVRAARALAGTRGVDPPALGAHVDRSELGLGDRRASRRACLCTRAVDEADRRRTALRLTRRGTEIVARAPEPYQARLIGVLRE